MIIIIIIIIIIMIIMIIKKLNSHTRGRTLAKLIQ